VPERGVATTAFTNSLACQVVLRLRQGSTKVQIRADADIATGGRRAHRSILYRTFTHSANSDTTVQRFDGVIDAVTSGVQPNTNSKA
jgi:hypothetical protein